MDEKTLPETDHSKAGKILILVFVFLIIASVGATYWRIFIKKDYVISAQADCDPMSENCFVWNCDPVVDGEGVCTGDPEDDIWYYKIVKRKAYNIPLCDPNEEDCDALMCPEGEKDCEEIYCTDETKTEEDVCITPEEYILENPEALSEEESACEEGDEECLNEEESESEEGLVEESPIENMPDEEDSTLE